MGERVAHQVRKQTSVRMPRRHIFIDTEAVSVRTKRGHVQSWRLGAAAYHSAEKGKKVYDRLATYAAPRELWADIAAFTRPKSRTIMWAHNLGYDVRISQAMEVLPSMGWRLVAHNLASRGTWLHWQRDTASLLMVDSASVYPDTLAHIAVHFQRVKEPLPDNNALAEDWYARCVRDVEILRDAVLAYLAWVEREGLGSWRMTGAGQSYAAFCSRFVTHPMEVHDDEEVLALERKAMWTGRCEAYWRGKTRNVTIEEWDLNLAYARIAQTRVLPVALIGPIDRGESLNALLSRGGIAVLADIQVSSSVPVLPSLVGGFMAWPIGTYDTTVWSPELALALRHGAEITVRGAWLYRTAPALRAWADWLISQMSVSNDETTAWQRTILKHWSRALIGRFGMNYHRWESFGTAEDTGLMSATIYDTRSGEQYEVTHVGKDVHRDAGVTEWGESQPMITGYVMSLCRVWLWRLMQALPPRSVLYVDTDSMLVSSEWHDDLLALSQTPLGRGLRLKTMYQSIDIRGPRQIVTDSRPKISGLPHRATLMPDGSFAGEVWSSLATSVQRGEGTTVDIRDRRWHVPGIDRRRLDGPDGWTRPITVEGGERV